MRTERQDYLGIDLGTTNSAQAICREGQTELVRNADGGVLTPSVVRIDAKKRVVVGARARKFLEQDPENTRGEFKRLMGSKHELDFPAAALKRSPAQLSAEVLTSLRRDFSEQLGYDPVRAVISVPALFELPQIAATSEAARLAGFERVEFIQEPIASALASGWSAEASRGSWLVYDLGGGTFDVSLLESREGLLRVVGHDGDNFLGGRDFDQALCDLVVRRLADEGVTDVDVRDPRHSASLRRLRAACETAKIDLSRAEEADLSLPGLFEIEGGRADVETTLTRADLDAITAPLVDRSVAVCLRLLERCGLRPDQLERIVLVGGPTVMPAVRTRIASALGQAVDVSHDPMTLVAHGAALFAFDQAMSARGASARGAKAIQPTETQSVWLQYAAVSADLHPYVVGRVAQTGDAAQVSSIVISRTDGGFTTPPAALDAERAFAVPVQLLPRTRSTFRISGVAPGARNVALEPGELSIMHGVSIGDPPLSRSLGIARADDLVQIFFERGSPLPLRRTFTLRTVEAVTPENPGFALRVPIVQGEFPYAHLCRLVGTLEIASEAVGSSIAAGSEVEVTLELDRGGRLTAGARIPCVEQYFSHVAHLAVPTLAADAMDAIAHELAARATLARGEAFRSGDPKAVRALLDLDQVLEEARRAIDLARGGDPDANERARRLLVDLEATITDVEVAYAWPRLEQEVEQLLLNTSYWLGKHGLPVERTRFEKLSSNVERALSAKNAVEIRRHTQAAQALLELSYYRDPESWPRALQNAGDRIAEARDPVRARAHLEEGRRALAKGDRAALETAVRELWKLLPTHRESRSLGYDSGVR